MLARRRDNRTGRWELVYTSDPRPEREDYDRVRKAAWSLYGCARAAGMRWSSFPLVDAVCWLIEAERSRGGGTWIIDYLILPPVTWRDPSPRRAPPPDPLTLLRNAAGWPATTHLRLHWLADRAGGWTCGVCNVGLVDVCSDEDIVLGFDGGRMIRPGSAKQLPHVDHVVPRDLGGSDDPGNLRLTCQPCNSSKGAS